MEQIKVWNLLILQHILSKIIKHRNVTDSDVITTEDCRNGLKIDDYIVDNQQTFYVDVYDENLHNDGTTYYLF